jgi:hypothetical protein
MIFADRAPSITDHPSLALIWFEALNTSGGRDPPFGGGDPHLESIVEPCGPS